MYLWYFAYEIFHDRQNRIYYAETTPNIRQIIQRHIHRLDELHKSEIMTTKDKDKKEVSRVLSR